MPKGYWIANVDVRDAAVYEKYRAANAKPFADFGAKFLVRGAPADVREGTSRPRIVVIEFASLADAVACYESADYQAAKDIRSAVSDGTLVIIEGYDG
ncbi:Uncharacterized conserved protein, DUF1330 family [Sulfitobacter marinus]|uniref:Uncharacterized conserved protein, DUF1330 family n=1 Tax=Sulfitobacter marinus TaxID=394264 RepID=A0A1I6PKU9_9RHOB|nr:DUF1330 domain-containing protein [Sulfitobacter marinus]SFS40833.1 Uncharacterized conserved protein, DUF1330 family [Sulfitobacter marinus]